MYSLEMTLNLTSFCHHNIVNNYQINLFSPEQKKKNLKNKNTENIEEDGQKKKGIGWY